MEEEAQIHDSYIDPDYEERRTPRSLAEMLGLRGNQGEVVLRDTGTRGIGSLVASPSRLGSGAEAEAIASAGGGNSSRWGMPRGRYRGGSLYDWGSSIRDSSGSGFPSSSRRPPAPQQQLRYTSLLEISEQTSSRQRSTWWGGGSHGWFGVDDFQEEEGECEQQEDELPSYEEAISQPARNRLSVPLIAEAERQVHAPIRPGYRSAHHPQQSQPPIHTSVSAQPAIATPPATAQDSPQQIRPQPLTTAHESPSQFYSLSRLTRRLRRKHSNDYIRPPPPHEGVPLELVCDKFGNRRRNIKWHGNSSGKLIWLGSLRDGGHGLPPTMGFSGRSVRWEERVLRKRVWA
ncbi:hypothetical protein EV426DRAFT_616014 [Tirmania nivea]|nr:hypothetical protein EV426DRAFT_616014 [Tirmania nivea]